MKKSNVFKIILQIYKENIRLSILLFIAITGVVLSSLVPPQIIRIIIDKNLYVHQNNNLLLLAFIYLGVIILIGLFDFFKEALLTFFGQKIMKKIRLQMIDKMGKLPSEYFSLNTSGAISSQIINDVDAINNLFTNGLISIIIDLFKIIGIIISIMIYNLTLGFFVILLLPLIYFLIRMFQKRMLKAQIENRIITGKVNNQLIESFKNIDIIKIYGKENYIENLYKETLVDNIKTIEKVNFYDSIFPPVMQIIRALVITIIVVATVSEVNLIGLTVGMIASSIDLVVNLFQPVENLGMELQQIQQAIAGVKRVNSFLLEKEDTPKDEFLNAEDIYNDKREIEIVFDNVSFSYLGGIEVLSNIDLKCESGKTTTFIGRTGVGKTTLFKLIMGLIKPIEGQILINGFDVHKILNSQKRKIFGYVGQNMYFLKGSIAECISLKDDDITKEEIKNALVFVNLWDYVSTLESGIDTIVDESLFSYGQKQLLAIARAIVLNPPLLLFDEITANLDSLTEENIMNVIKKVQQKYTILTISHRISGMMNADKIVILENGKIKNQGSVSDVLETDDDFYEDFMLEKLTWK